MTVWDSLVGQRQRGRDALRQAAAGQRGMTHAWLFTGPPGSGRSNAALAFAAALQCEAAGCGECEACRTTLAGSHPDVTVHRTERRMIISVDDARQWVRDAALMPVRQRWQIDRGRGRRPAQRAGQQRAAQGDRGADAADGLDAVRAAARRRAADDPLAHPPREPRDAVAPRRSRTSSCRASTSRRPGPPTPRGPARVTSAAPRRSRLEEDTRSRRREVVAAAAPADLPRRLHDRRGQPRRDRRPRRRPPQTDEAERQGGRRPRGALRRGPASPGRRGPRRPRTASSSSDQKARVKRQVLDAVDRSLTELLSVYRDVLVVQTGAGGALVNEEQRGAGRGARPADDPGGAPCTGSTRSTRPASRCWSSTSHRCWRWSR